MSHSTLKTIMEQQNTSNLDANISVKFMSMLSEERGGGEGGLNFVFGGNLQ